MPIIKSAKKKLKKDRKKTRLNRIYENAYKKTLKQLKKHKGKKPKNLLKELHSQIDKAAKKGIISKKKANRLKSLASFKTTE